MSAKDERSEYEGFASVNTDHHDSASPAITPINVHKSIVCFRYFYVWHAKVELWWNYIAVIIDCLA